MQLANSKVLMDQQTQKNVDEWLSGSYDETTKNEIKRLQNENPQELIDSFYQNLEFGTGGLRGKMGVGTNRMNLYTVRAATQGLANYISKQPKKGKRQRVLIGYDSRNHSRTFAEETAKVLAANDIEVFFFQDMRPVALVSFGLLHKNCIAAVMITASHNPPEYNGYKVWWENGVQVLPPHDAGIIQEVNKIKDPSQVKTGGFSKELIQEVGEEIDAAYLASTRDLALYPEENRSKGKTLKVVYTPLFGAGITMVPRALTDWGFSTIALVQEQCKPDGNFPGLKSPNPEEPAALKLGIEKLQALKSDLLIATDPDSDRLAVVVMHQGAPQLLNGNETACLILDHICSALHKSHKTPPRAAVIKTIVTTELFKAIADSYSVALLDVLTGFKYIGEKIALWQRDPKQSPHYLFGGEESFGCLYGTHARDKDAIIASTIICEAALALKNQGKTLVDQLYSLYQQHGIFREKLLSLTFEGKTGMEKIHAMMTQMRQNPPKSIHNVAVTFIEDYQAQTSFNPLTGAKASLDLPVSDVLRFWLEDGTKIVVRPSGTEPKIKIYVGVFDKSAARDYKAIQKGIQDCDQKADNYLKTFKNLLG